MTIDWKAFPEHKPPVGKLILVEITKTPLCFTQEYTALCDGSDRTASELRFRELTATFYRENPVQLAKTYKSFLHDVKIMVRANHDSRQGFIVCDEVSRWALVE